MKNTVSPDRTPAAQLHAAAPLHLCVTIWTYARRDKNLDEYVAMWHFTKAASNKSDVVK